MLMQAFETHKMQGDISRPTIIFSAMGKLKEDIFSG